MLRWSGHLSTNYVSLSMQAPQATSPFHERTPLKRRSNTIRTLTATSGINFFLHHALLVAAMRQVLRWDRRQRQSTFGNDTSQQRRHGQARLGAAYLRWRTAQRSSHRRSGMVYCTTLGKLRTTWAGSKLQSCLHIITSRCRTRHASQENRRAIQQIENGRAATLIEVFA